MSKATSPKIVSKKHLARLEKERIQNKVIVIASIVVLVLVIGVVSFGILDATIFQGSKSVAKVGKEKINTTQFIKYVRFQRQQVINQYYSTVSLANSFGDNQSLASYFQSTLSQLQTQLSDPQTIGSQILDQMVNDRLIRQKAREMGITVSQDEIESTFRGYFQYYPEGTPTTVPQPTDQPTPTYTAQQLSMIATLTPTAGSGENAATATQSAVPTVPEGSPSETATTTPSVTVTPLPTPTEYTLAGFQKLSGDYFANLAKFNFGEADLKELIEFSLYRQKVYDEVTKDLNQEQDQVWARHILVASEQEAKDIKAKLDAGANWTDLAIQYSQDTSNSFNGGDLGWFGPGVMVSEFETAAFATPVGQISEPVKTQFGWHLIQVIGHEKRPLTSSEFTSLKDKAFEKWLATTAEEVGVERYDYWKEIVPSDPAL